MPHTVLLTGATGFVGSHVAELLTSSVRWLWLAFRLRRVRRRIEREQRGTVPAVNSETQ